ncbi:MAG: hypothetical protein IJJ33_14800, partial [Victivallales bacterium]|nr:hypothetical protein [Victivallales bacterium]
EGNFWLPLLPESELQCSKTPRSESNSALLPPLGVSEFGRRKEESNSNAPKLHAAKATVHCFRYWEFRSSGD